MKYEKTNQEVVSLISFLKKYSYEEEAPIWRDIAKRLERPNRSWAVVNVSKLDRFAEAQDAVIVPGSLLGSGEINKPLTVAAVKVSHSAIVKIENAGGSVVTLDKLATDMPKGKGIKILG